MEGGSFEGGASVSCTRRSACLSLLVLGVTRYFPSSLRFVLGSVSRSTRFCGFGGASLSPFVLQVRGVFLESVALSDDADGCRTMTERRRPSILLMDVSRLPLVIAVVVVALRAYAAPLLDALGCRPRFGSSITTFPLVFSVF